LFFLPQGTINDQAVIGHAHVPGSRQFSLDDHVPTLKIILRRDVEII